MRKTGRHSSRITLATLLLVTLAPAASASRVAETASKWGLIGSWSLDCSLAPDRDRGTILIYAIARGGRLMFRRDFGDEKDDNEVVGAKVSDDGMLNLRVYFPSLKQGREYGLMMQPDGTLRAMYNRDRNGEYTIKDGKFTGNGNPTPSQYKCN